MKLEEVKTPEGRISLSKLFGKPLDVVGYISKEFGEPTFKMTQIQFADGTLLWCEGEHDMAYLTNGYGEKAAKFDRKVLESLYQQENGEEEEDEVEGEDE